MSTTTAQPASSPASGAPPGKNAVERRLDQLLVQWTEFAQQPAARVLVWSARDDERSMLNAFLTVQSEPGAESPDFFLRQRAPLARPEGYPSALLLELAALYEEVRPQLVADGVPDTFAIDAGALAAARAGRATMEQWLGALGAFAGLYSAGESVLAVSLEPTPVPALKAWEEWLRALLGAVVGGGAAVSPRVRFILADSVEAPLMPGLVAALPATQRPRVHVVPCALEMPAAMEELAATGAVAPAAGGTGGPGPAFRRLFVALTGAIGAGDQAKAAQSAGAALAIAREEGWPQMQAVVHMTVGAGALGVGKIDDAVAAYRAAGGVCAAVLGAADGGVSAGPGVAPALAKVSLHAKLGEAAALFSGARYKEAAAVYEAAAPAAAALKDGNLLLECWRMACHCHVQLKGAAAAARCGREGLKAAGAMDAAAREASTLAYLARELTALQPASSDEGRQTRETLAALLGPKWEEKVAAATGDGAGGAGGGPGAGASA